MPTTRATKETAQQLGVSAGTVRNWSDQFAAFLSESARPGHQPERRFTEQDIAVLRYIAQLRSEGLQQPEIAQRLSETTIQPGEILATTDDNTPQQTASEAIQTAPDAPEASMLAIKVLEALDGQNRRIEALEHGRRDNVIAFTAGVIVTLLFVLVIIGLAVLWGGFR